MSRKQQYALEYKQLNSVWEGLRRLPYSNCYSDAFEMAVFEERKRLEQKAKDLEKTLDDIHKQCDPTHYETENVYHDKIEYTCLDCGRIERK